MNKSLKNISLKGKYSQTMEYIPTEDFPNFENISLPANKMLNDFQQSVNISLPVQQNENISLSAQEDFPQTRVSAASIMSGAPVFRVTVVERDQLGTGGWQLEPPLVQFFVLFEFFHIA